MSTAPDALSIITCEVAHQAACQLQTSPVGFPFCAASFVIIGNGPVLRAQSKRGKSSFRYCSRVLWYFFYLPSRGCLNIFDHASFYAKEFYLAWPFLVPGRQIKWWKHKWKTHEILDDQHGYSHTWGHRICQCESQDTVPWAGDTFAGDAHRHKLAILVQSRRTLSNYSISGPWHHSWTSEI